MVRGDASKSERSLQVGQHAVDLQGLTERRGTLVADLVGVQTAIRGKQAHGQQMVKEWSRDGQEIFV